MQVYLAVPLAAHEKWPFTTWQVVDVDHLYENQPSKFSNTALSESPSDGRMVTGTLENPIDLTGEDSDTSGES